MTSPEVDGNTSDGYHTFDELYHIRALLNAALFNSWTKSGYRVARNVHKSLLHEDGTMFEGGWFIVVAEIPQTDGTWVQISFHYSVEKYWDMFDIWTRVRASAWDGHDAPEAYRRLENFLKLEGSIRG